VSIYAFTVENRHTALSTTSNVYISATGANIPGNLHPVLAPETLNRCKMWSMLNLKRAVWPMTLSITWWKLLMTWTLSCTKYPHFPTWASSAATLQLSLTVILHHLHNIHRCFHTTLLSVEVTFMSLFSYSAWTYSLLLLSFQFCISYTTPRQQLLIRNFSLWPVTFYQSQKHSDSTCDRPRKRYHKSCDRSIARC